MIGGMAVPCAELRPMLIMDDTGSRIPILNLCFVEFQPKRICPILKTSIKLPSAYVVFERFARFLLRRVMLLQLKTCFVVFDFQPKGGLIAN